MAINAYLDVTTEFNANNAAVVDMSGWDSAIFQFVGSSGTINSTATNDDGAVTGTTAGSPKIATNFQTAQITRISDGTTVTTVASAGLFKVGDVGRFIRFGGAAAAATKVLVKLTKIS